MEFQLAPWNRTDVDDLVQYGNNEKIAANLRDGYPFPYTRADAEAFLSSCVEAGEETQYLRAIRVEGHAVGGVGVFLQGDVYRKNGELGYWLAEPYWGRGLMSRAVPRLCRQVFDRYGLRRIFAEPYAYNLGSRRVLEKCGFVLEGILRQNVFKRGSFHDSCLYSLLREELG